MTKTNKSQSKKAVYFIATKYKNQPVDVAFYLKDGKRVSEKRVKKVTTKSGTSSLYFV